MFVLYIATALCTLHNATSYIFIFYRGLVQIRCIAADPPLDYWDLCRRNDKAEA